MALTAQDPSTVRSYRPEIDGLRAFAVLAVIINHFNTSILQGGFLGVDIFFVISGYVVTLSLCSHSSYSVHGFIARFWLRRFTRLVPALLIFVILSSIILCFFHPLPEISLKTGLASLFGVSNIFLLSEKTNYFAELPENNIFIHTWSLGVETQFYIFYPFLIWITRYGRPLKTSDLYLFLALVVSATFSLIGFIYFYNINLPFAYFSSLARFWEIAFGSLLFISLTLFPTLRFKLQQLSSIWVLALIALVMLSPLSHNIVANVLVVGLTSLLLGSLKEDTLAFNFLVHPMVVHIGLISYSLYLWHWAVIVVSRLTIGIHWWSIPFQFAFMLLLAHASYRFIEIPFRQASLLPHGHRLIVLSVVSTLMTSLVLAFYGIILKPGLYLGKINIGKIEQFGIKSLLTPYIVRGLAGSWQGEECVLTSNNEVGTKFNLHNCTIGSTSTNAVRVLVIGDSFAASFVHSFLPLLRTNRYSVTITSSWAASPAPDIPNHSPWDQSSNYYWKQLLPEMLHHLKRGDILFVINDLSVYSSGDNPSSIAFFRKGIIGLSNNLSKKGIRLVYMHSIPNATIAKCTPDDLFLQWFETLSNRDHACIIAERKVSLSKRRDLDNMFSALQKNRMIQIVDLFDIFCPTRLCSYYGANNVILYRDRYSHPSVEAARLSAARIKATLERSY